MGREASRASLKGLRSPLKAKPRSEHGPSYGASQLPKDLGWREENTIFFFGSGCVACGNLVP